MNTIKLFSQTLVGTLIVSAVGCLAAPQTVQSLAPVRMAQAPPMAMPATAMPAVRPAAVPLIAHDPYFSVWSNYDKLTDGPTRHWTGHPQPMTGLIRVDGQAFRLMGTQPDTIPAFPQTNVQVLPTRTIYTFAGSGVNVTMTFTSPALPDDIDVTSRPVTYLTWDVRSIDGKQHTVSLYDDASAELAVNQPTQNVTWTRGTVGTMTALRIGSQDQPILAKKGDDLRIDWGYLYLAAPTQGAQVVLATGAAAQFAANGTLLTSNTSVAPSPASDAPVAAVSFDLGRVGNRPVSRHILLAYDDIYSIEYFGNRLRPYWRRNGMSGTQLLQAAERDYASLMMRCVSFDSKMMADMTRVGGKDYATLCALSYRQCLAANKIAADTSGQPLLFPKENFSNGCIATVDIIYPMGPQFLLFNPTLAKASLVPIMAYAASSRWKFPFAPHDLGTYPQANGQVYGGGERTEDNQMPVEESGNMLILLAAIAMRDGNANFASRWWPQCTQWATYLQTQGFDPSNQLCTDDFAGHLAHNANLSAKAIEALGAYSILCNMRGEKAEAQKYRTIAQGMADQWVKAADDGDHTRLAFDKPNTWSQKYNMVWDSILGLNFFPRSVIERDYAYYLAKRNAYGAPLDNRRDYTKLDWTVWSATMAKSRTEFEALVSPILSYVNATQNRTPLSDWYHTVEPRQAGFQARAVVGGVFIKAMSDPALWKQYAALDRKTVPATAWARFSPAPRPVVSETLAATSEQQGQTWRYTFDKPNGNWYATTYDAAAWKEGAGGFGTRDTPGAVVRTDWTTADIWLRRDFTLQGTNFGDVKLLLHHDEDAEVYINGVLAIQLGGFTGAYDVHEISPAALATLKPGLNTIAVHCHQTGGGQYVDAGLVRVRLVTSPSTP